MWAVGPSIEGQAVDGIVDRITFNCSLILFCLSLVKCMCWMCWCSSMVRFSLWGGSLLSGCQDHVFAGLVLYCEDAFL